MRAVGLTIGLTCALACVGLVCRTAERHRLGVELMRAAASQDAAEVSRLLSRGADPNASDKGRTSLRIAVVNADLPTIRLLLDSGASTKDLGDGMPPLPIAAAHGHTEVLRMLVTAGADVNIRWRDDGQTALIRAGAGGHIQAVKFLLAHGARIDDRDSSGKTAEVLARSQGHTEVADYLRSLASRSR